MKKVGHFIQHSEVNKEQLHVSGTSLFHKNICVNSMKNIGHCRVEGNIESAKIINKGSIATEVCQVGSIKNLGSMQSDEMMAKTIYTSGNFHCKGDVEAELFQAKGTVHIEGYLKCKTISMEIGPISFVQHMIGKENINIRASKLNIISLAKKELKVQQIEGKSIYLERVNAKYVKGENVIVGPNCNIEKIYYQNKISIDQDSKVISTVKDSPINL